MAHLKQLDFAGDEIVRNNPKLKILPDVSVREWVVAPDGDLAFGPILPITGNFHGEDRTLRIFTDFVFDDQRLIRFFTSLSGQKIARRLPSAASLVCHCTDESNQDLYSMEVMESLSLEIANLRETAKAEIFLPALGVPVGDINAFISTLSQRSIYSSAPQE